MNKFLNASLGLLILIVSLMQPVGAGLERCCYYNGKKIGCSWRFSDVERSLYIHWKDGVKEAYKLIRKDAFYRKIYEDSRGGIWEYWLGAQGNERLTNLVNGNEIYVPLRGCAR